MRISFSRRSLLGAAGLALPWQKSSTAATLSLLELESFPQQPPSLVREMVTVSHGNLNRVKELLEAHPALAKAAIDWGFGDWESALGAASHTGNHEIAELLLAHGARPSLFSAAMQGQLDVVRALLAAQPGAQRIPGPHSISLLAHAKAGGARSAGVFRYLEELGDAGAPASPPITEEEAAALAGTYSFGPGPTERIQIGALKAQVSFTRAGTATRNLIHLGERIFHPAGAAAVRVIFGKTGKDHVLTVHDPDVILTAIRIP
jgi:hypothetical protein